MFPGDILPLASDRLLGDMVLIEGSPGEPSTSGTGDGSSCRCRSSASNSCTWLSCDFGLDRVESALIVVPVVLTEAIPGLCGSVLLRLYAVSALPSGVVVSPSAPWLSALSSALRWRRLLQNMISAIMAIAASPPTTPPAIAPAFEDFFASGGEALLAVEFCSPGARMETICCFAFWSNIHCEIEKLRRSQSTIR